MTPDEIIKKIEAEQKHAKTDLHDADGMARLKKVAAAYSGEHELVGAHDLLVELSQRPKIDPQGTGLPLLDSIIGGVLPQQLVTISAHSKHGKTAFALFLMGQMENMAPVMIPLEQSNEEIVLQLQSNGYPIPNFLSPRKLAARITVEWIEERVIEGIAKYNSKLVVIDHLGYIDDFGEKGRFAKENLAYRIQVVMQQLKTIAKRWDVTILLLVHISQADESKPPSNSDLKGSSGILQESDMVIFLWRKNELKNKIRVYSDKTMVSVTANRRTGKNGNIGLIFDTNTGKYREENGWVESMMKRAESSVATDELFDEM